VPATCLRPEPAENSPRPQPYFFKINFNILFVPTTRLGIHLLHLSLQSKCLYAFLVSPMRIKCLSHFIFLDLMVVMTFGAQCSLCSFSFSTFSILLSLLPSRVQTLPLAPCSQTPLLYTQQNATSSSILFAHHLLFLVSSVSLPPCIS
jgi:hypothetical protein